MASTPGTVLNKLCANNHRFMALTLGVDPGGKVAVVQLREWGSLASGFLHPLSGVVPSLTQDIRPNLFQNACGLHAQNRTFRTLVILTQLLVTHTTTTCWKISVYCGSLPNRQRPTLTRVIVSTKLCLKPTKLCSSMGTRDTWKKIWDLCFTALHSRSLLLPFV